MQAYGNKTERKIMCVREAKVCPFRREKSVIKCVMPYIDVQAERGIFLGLTT